MKKFHLFKYSLFGVALAVSLGAHSRQLTGEEALQRALANWQTQGRKAAPVSSYTTHTLQGAYVFSRPGQGFIVAPADDQLPAVLAYVDEGHYNPAEMPPAFQAWLDEITRHGAYTTPISSKADKETDTWLLEDIAWTQESPMNDLCPKYYYGGYNYSTYAGCVAVALAQIMRYHQHPQQGTGSIAYTTDSYGLEVLSHLDEHTYDWTQILPNYLYTQPSVDQKTAVAQLVYDIAAACHMDFGPNASNTQDYRAGIALKQHFGYDASLQLIDHSQYSTAAWADVLRQEIDARRPVYLSGANVRNSESGDMVAGHAFVVDGYNSKGFFHINWGWNGTSNGFYLLTDLTPKNQGVGGSTGGYAFMQNAIIGIQPDKGGSESPANLTLMNDYWKIERDLENDGYKIYVTLGNPTATDFDGFIALRLTENGTDLLSPKDMAWRMGCKAGMGGTLGKGIQRQYLAQHPGARLDLVYVSMPGASAATEAEAQAMLSTVNDATDWTLIASRKGAPQSLLVYADEHDQVQFLPDPDQAFRLAVTDLTADAPLTAGSTGNFTAHIKNEGDFEYFAPLYLMCYDDEGTLVGYSDYHLDLLPAHSDTELHFSYILPSNPGSYHFCIDYETLAYDYGYEPVPRQGDAAGYTFVFNINKAEDVDPDPEHPEDGTIQDYVMECVDYGEDAIRRHVKVRIEGDVAYIQGLSSELPEAWATATINNGVADFGEPQLLGTWHNHGTAQQQYLYGADTGTGDPAPLIMEYDARSRSFFSYSNRWLFLSKTPLTMNASYDHLYSGLTILPASEAGDDPLVTPPDGLATSVYQLKGSHPYNHIPTDYTLNIGYTGSEVYVQGLYPALPAAWVKGSIADGKVTFDTPQYVGNYHGLYDMFVSGVDPFSEEMQQLVMDYDARTRTFTSTADNWFLVQAGRGDEVNPMMLLTGVTITPYQAPVLDYHDVVLPGNLAESVAEYRFTARNADLNSGMTDKSDEPVRLVWDGSTVYVQGLSTHFPEAWIKGVVDAHGVVVFSRNQHVGVMMDHDIWLGAGDATSGEIIYGDFVLLYDKTTGVFTQPESNYLAFNAATDKLYDLELYHEVTLVPEGYDGIARIPTATSAVIYDLTGRRVAANHHGVMHGVMLKEGRKIIR